MNSRELSVAKRYEADGWKVLRGGAPDFIMLRVKNGEIKEVRAVEVKSPGSSLSYEQHIYRMVFQLANLEYVVEVEV